MSTKKKISILGSTGIIGINVLNIIDRNKNQFEVSLLSFNKNIKLGIFQIKKYKPKFVIVTDDSSYKKIKKKYKNTKVFNTLQNFENYVKKFNISFYKTFLAVSGIFGLDYAFLFSKFSKYLCIANKESIVCGGKIFINHCNNFNCIISPIDSEHYCLKKLFEIININKINNIYITASGGPFLKKKYKQFYKAKINQTTKHPNWKMGKKISVDSATMVNKIFEIIEANVLFNLKPGILNIKVHPQSKVHAIVNLKNGLSYMLAHENSMSIPIRNSLLDKVHLNNNDIFLNNKNITTLTFEERSLKKFKIVDVALQFIKNGQRSHIFFNVLNDHLVDLYLNKKIFFYEIEKNLIKMLTDDKVINYCKKKVTNFSEIKMSILDSKKMISSLC